MLIDFTIGNYRSIKEPVTLSAIEANRGPGRARQGSGKRRGIKTDGEIAVASPVAGRSFSLLPVLGIFGANESGKTNVLRGLDDLLWLMSKGEPSEPVIPFKLNPISAASPTDFRLRVVIDGAVYDYSLQIGRTCVRRESLKHSPRGDTDSRQVFSRNLQEQVGIPIWQMSEDLKPLLGDVPMGIRADQPLMELLSKYETHPVLSALAVWLRQSVRGMSMGYSDIEKEIAAYWTMEQELSRKAILRLLRSFDFSIVDLEVRPGTDAAYEVIVFHETPQGRIAWSLDQESLGTQRLFEIAPKLLWSLHHGKLALFDELGTNLHPYVTERIVRLFQNPETNDRGAQLIFTSHDNTLLQNQLLRRDQVLFTEKRSDGSTDLYSVSDFRARNDLALDKAYLDGRFGAVPVLPGEEDMLAIAGQPE